MVERLLILLFSSTIAPSLGSRTEVDARQELYLVLMAPYPAENPANNPSWVAGHVVGPAVQLALDEINNRSDILRDYKLVLIETDTACSGKYNVRKAILDILLSDKHIVGIVGPGCSGAATAVAEQILRPRYSLIAITPSATSPYLEREEYINTFATISSSTAYVKVFRKLMLLNRWKGVSVLYDDKRSYFLETFRRFSERVSRSYIAFESPVHNGKNEKFFPLREIKDSEMVNGRVIFSFAAGGTARIMMCLAYHFEMTYPTYQWVFHDRTIPDLLDVGDRITFNYDGINYSCTQENMVKAIKGILLVQYNLRPNNEEIITPTGKNFSDFRANYITVLEQRNITDATDSLLNYGNTNYDAAWAIALALNRTTTSLNLTTYRYGQPSITEEIRNHLYKVHFQGASGAIQFDNETRSTVTNINVFQVQTPNSDSGCKHETYQVRVAFFNGTLNDIIILPGMSSSAFINDTFDRLPLYIHLSLGIIVILIALALLGCAGILHTANTVWYRYRSIKATSPNISHLIFSGCYLLGISIIIFAAQHTFEWSQLVYSVMCNAFRWCLIMGYTLIFGTVLAKVWRVYRLFKHFRNKSPGCLVSDNALIVFVILLLFVDFFICILWDAFDPFLRTDHIETRTQINKIPSLLIRSKCMCRYFDLWLAVIGTYKGTIALLLVVFSILNRKIRRRDFQHTKKINILIYSLTMMGGVFFPLFFLLNNSDIHISFIILCFMLSIAVLMSCLVLFLSPVGQVIKVKMGLPEDAQFTEEIRRRVSIASMISVKSATSDAIDSSVEL